jgi:hypothetical protein
LVLLLLLTYIHLPFHSLPCKYATIALWNGVKFDLSFLKNKGKTLDLCWKYIVPCIISRSKPLDFKQVISFHEECTYLLGRPLTYNPVFFQASIGILYCVLKSLYVLSIKFLFYWLHFLYNLYFWPPF